MDTKTATIENKFTHYQVLVIVLIALTQFTVVLDFMVMSLGGSKKDWLILILPNKFELRTF